MDKKGTQLNKIFLNNRFSDWSICNAGVSSESWGSSASLRCPTCLWKYIREYQYQVSYQKRDSSVHHLRKAHFPMNWLTWWSLYWSPFFLKHCKVVQHVLLVCLLMKEKVLFWIYTSLLSTCLSFHFFLLGKLFFSVVQVSKLTIKPFRSDLPANMSTYCDDGHLYQVHNPLIYLSIFRRPTYLSFYIIIYLAIFLHIFLLPLGVMGAGPYLQYISNYLRPTYIFI